MEPPDDRDFVRFVMTVVRGEPVNGRWPCPRCEAYTVRVKQPTSSGKVYWKCAKCPDEAGVGYGDALDLLKPLYRNFDVRRHKLAELRAEFEAETDDAPATPSTRNATDASSPPGAGELRSDPASAADAWGDMSPGERSLMAAAVEIARARGVEVEGLAYYSWHAERWFRESDLRELRTCTDPDCDALVCRAAREHAPKLPDETPAETEVLTKARRIASEQRTDDRDNSPAAYLRRRNAARKRETA